MDVSEPKGTNFSHGGIFNTQILKKRKMVYKELALVIFLLVTIGTTAASENIIHEGIEDLATNAIVASSLPKIDYNKKEIQEIIEELPISTEVRSQVDVYLKNIEEKFIEIQKYQSKENPENFYEPMRNALLEIHNTALEIYDLIKHYHPVLPNTLKQLILKRIMPLQAALEKQLEMSEKSRAALELKTKRLYAEQSFLSRNSQLQSLLIQHLNELKKLLSKKGRPAPRCYISYAWPSEENKKQEYWVQPFLYVLYDHLTAAGIRVIMDIRDNKPGDSIYQFMKQYHEGNYIILVGTESLLQKHYGEKTHAVQTELSIIVNRFEQDQKQFGQSRIYPMLISGTIQSSYPEIYDKYRTVRDAREHGYLGALKKLMDWMYEPQLPEMKQHYTDLWHGLYEKSAKLPTTEAEIDQEISLNYHRQRLDSLRQDLQYQSVEAQEKTKHSPAITTMIVGALMESQGNNSKTLFDENGQQFQRPSITPDFIERQELWDKIIKYFNQSGQQILTLTVHGLGGVGKTTLAQEYYLHPPRPYTLRAWFNAEKREQLYAQYIELASENGIRFLKDLSIEQKINKIKDWLAHQKNCLLIYDNVPDIKTIEGLLPEEGKHHILITSRNSVDWPEHQKFNIDVMEEHESVSLIKKITGGQENEEALKKLVNILGHLPLALAQAGAYMSEKQTTVEDYLKLYQQYQSIIMKDKTLVRNPKHEPVWITFEMNLKALEKSCPEALVTLKQISWLDASNIPETLLKAMMEKIKHKPSDLLWNDIKNNIRRYSFVHIDVEGHKLSIHRLLQDIIRSRQNKVEQTIIFKKICKTIDQEFNRKTQVLENEIRQKELLPHLQMLLKRQKSLGNNMELQLVPIINDLGTVFFLAGEARLSKSYYKNVLEILEKHYRRRNFAQGNLNSSLQESEQIIKQNSFLTEAHHLPKASFFQLVYTLDQLGRTYRYLGDPKQAKEIHKQALIIKEKYYGLDHVEIAFTLYELGRDYNYLGYPKKAKKIHERALKIMEKYYDKDHIEIAYVLNQLGDDYRYLGNANKAKEIHERTLEIKEKYYGHNHVEVAFTLFNLGLDYEVLGNARQAKEIHKRTLSLLEQYYGKNHIEVAWALYALGIDYRDLGDPKQAKNLHERAVSILEQYFSKDHFEMAWVMFHLGNDYRDLGDTKRAREVHEGVLTTYEKFFGRDHFEVALTLDQLGNDYRDLGNIMQAKENYERALKIKEKYYSDDHPEVAKTLANLGGVYIILNKIDLGKSYLERALMIKESYYGMDHVEVAETLVELGNINIFLKNIDQAKIQLRRALKIRENYFGLNHPLTMNVNQMIISIGPANEFPEKILH